jgi:hypothetical protein
MSSNFLQMLRSDELVTSAFRKAYPQYASEFDEALAGLTALKAWDPPLAAALAAKLFQSDRRIALKLPLLSLVKAGGMLKNAVAKRFFCSLEMFTP